MLSVVLSCVTGSLSVWGVVCSAVIKKTHETDVSELWCFLVSCVKGLVSVWGVVCSTVGEIELSVVVRDVNTEILIKRMRVG